MAERLAEYVGSGQRMTFRTWDRLPLARGVNLHQGSKPEGSTPGILRDMRASVSAAHRARSDAPRSMHDQSCESSYDKRSDRARRPLDLTTVSSSRVCPSETAMAYSATGSPTAMPSLKVYSAPLLRCVRGSSSGAENTGTSRQKITPDANTRRGAGDRRMGFCRTNSWGAGGERPARLMTHK